MSSRRRCRNWNGCDKQRDKKNRKCICRNKCFCNDRFRERIKEIDLVTTPSGDLVGMVHCNNCTSDLNAWVNLFKEFAQNFGVEDVDMDQLYGTLYNKALEGDKDCGGLLAYNYFSGEHITGFEEGRPLFVRKPDSNFNLANFMRVHLYTALGALKTGLDILMKEEMSKLIKCWDMVDYSKQKVLDKRSWQQL